MSHAAVNDIYINTFKVCCSLKTKHNFVGNKKIYYLITSPEYHMKRLLVAGSGPIFQISRCFRSKEFGRYHNPEFTMLEWYRLYYSMHDLMLEVDDLLQEILIYDYIEIVSYQEIFKRYVAIDPLSSTRNELYDKILKFNLTEAVSINDDCDILLQILFTTIIEPFIGCKRPIFIYHFPVSQAALAKVNKKDCRIVDRFEVYFKGIELANGFCELTDVKEHYHRFAENNRKRIAQQLPEEPIDNNFLDAVKQGLPECSGVSIGIDRLVMLAIKAYSLKDTIAFSIDRS